MSIVTLDAAKKQLNAADAGAVDDTELQLYVDAVTVPIEKALGRVVDARAFTDTKTVAGARQILLSHTPVTALTSVSTVDGTQTWDVAALRVDQDSGVLTVVSGPPFTGDVMFIYTAGVSPADPNAQVAALITIQHLWETKRGTMDVTTGGDMEPWSPTMGFALPRRATELLGTSLPGIA